MADLLPNMKPGEQEALDKAKARVAKIRETAFNYMRDLDCMDPQSLDSCGYRNLSNAEAVHRAFKSALKDCDKVWAQFLKQFPDE